MKSTLLALAALGATDAKINLFGKCPPVKLADNFNQDKYAGNWYEISRDSEFFYEMGQECVTQQFTSQANGTLDLYFRAWMW